MRKYMLTAALVAAGLPLAPAMARTMDGYVVRTTLMRAGPDYDYPAVQRLRRDSAVRVYGCLRDWNWCDVSNRYERGWVPRQNIVVNYRGRRRYISSSTGVLILSFSFGNYWDSYYRDRPFYSQRPRWEQHYNNNYQPSWGPRSPGPRVTPQQRQPAEGRRQGGRPQVQAAPGRQSAPNAPQVAPQRRRNETERQQSAPAQKQVAPVSGNASQRRVPGNQGGGQRGNSQGQPNKDRKSRD
jgi:uncharacterized protein YraI